MATPHLPAELRDTLARALTWEDAHVALDRAVDGLPESLRGATAAGFDHSPWQVLEHLRLALADLVAFALEADYSHTWTVARRLLAVRRRTAGRRRVGCEPRRHSRRPRQDGCAGP